MLHSHIDQDLTLLQPAQIVEYLDAGGWMVRHDAGYGPDASVFAHPTGAEVIVIRNESDRFYLHVVHNMLETVADVNGTSPQSVYQAIRYLRRDTIRFRVADEDSVPPKDFADLTEGAYTAWKAAVDTVLTESDERKRYWRDARVEQTERGSFIVPLVSPMVLDTEQLNLWGSDEGELPYRSVTRVFQRSLAATRGALDVALDGGDWSFEEARKQGVTLKMWEGLLQAIKPFNRVDCHIAESPLPHRPTQPPTAVSFKRADVSPLREAVNELKTADHPEVQKTSRSGYLQSFKHVMDSDEHQVTMKIYRGTNETQTINILLDKQQYNLAFQLHLDDEQVDAIGTLEKSGVKTWVMREARIRRSRSGEGWDDDNAE